jgi:hypothetical protein
MRRIVVIGMLLTACSGPPPVLCPAGAGPGQQAIQPAAARHGGGVLHNPTNNGPAINVTVGAMVVGRLAPMSWMRVELGAGWHAMSCTTANSANPSSITVAPGQIRFVDIEMPPGSGVCSIREASPEADRAGVLAGARALQIQ